MLNQVTEMLREGRLGYVRKFCYFTMLEKKVDDDDDFIKLPGLPNRVGVRYAATNQNIAAVASHGDLFNIQLCDWLSNGGNLRLISKRLYTSFDIVTSRT